MTGISRLDTRLGKKDNFTIAMLIALMPTGPSQHLDIYGSICELQQ